MKVRTLALAAVAALAILGVAGGVVPGRGHVRPASNPKAGA